MQFAAPKVAGLLLKVELMEAETRGSWNTVLSGGAGGGNGGGAGGGNGGGGDGGGGDGGGGGGGGKIAPSHMKGI